MSECLNLETSAAPVLSQLSALPQGSDQQSSSESHLGQPALSLLASTDYLFVLLDHTLLSCQCHAGSWHAAVSVPASPSAVNTR